MIFKTRQIDGIKIVKGESVSIKNYENLECFIYRESKEMFWVVEVRSGLSIGNGSTSKSAIDDATNRLIWQQSYNETFPSIYEQVNSHIDANGSIDDLPKYADTAAYKPTKNEMVECLTNGLKFNEVEIARCLKQSMNVDMLYMSNKRIKDRLEQINLIDN